MSEPIYDEDMVNLGYLKRIISNTEDEVNEKYENVSRHYASRPQPPYNKGDTWIDGDVVYTCINSRQIGNYADSDWVTESGATEKAENKNKTYLTKPSNYSPGDMWILQSDNDHKAGKKGEILISTAGRKDYDEDDWINMLGYGSIRSINEVADNLNGAINRIGNVEEAIEDGIIVTFYQDSVPEGKHLGDLWYVTGEAEGYTKGKIYRYDGAVWILLDDPEIQKAFDEANEARLVADGKIQSFYSDTEPTKDMGVGDLWIDLANNNQLYRYNGTKWVAVYDTRINDLVVNVDTVTERVTTIETDLGKIDLKVEETTTKVTTIEENAIKTVQVQYALGNSTTTAPTSGWSTTAPTWESGKYMWQRTVTTYSDDTTKTSEPTCIQGAKGETGADGKDGVNGKDGDTGIGVNSLETEYYLSTSDTEQTGGEWSSTEPKYETDKYYWTRTKITWTDNSVTYTEPILAEGINNANQSVDNITNTEGTASGKNIHIEDSSEEPLVDIVVKGETKQEGEPSPDYPSEIENIDNVEINVVGKNIIPFPYYNKTITKEGVTFTQNDDGSITINGTATASKGYHIFARDINSISPKEGKYTFSGVTDGSSTTYYLQLYINGKSQVSVTTKPKTYSIDEGDVINQISFFFKEGAVFDNLIIKPQLEYGTEATDYEPYKSQTETFPLAEGQKLYEGSYLADDGIHQTRKQYVITGQEDWKLYSSKTHTFTMSLGLISGNGICTHYKNIGTTAFDVDTGIYLKKSNAAIISDTRFSTVEEFKTYLAEQYSMGTPIIVECSMVKNDFVTPIIEIIPYTEKQQEAWNKIKELYTYKNITNITSTADLDIVYVRDNGLSDMYETKQNANKRYEETIEKFAETKITTDGIQDTVSKTETTVANNYKELKTKFDDYAPKSDIVTIQNSVEKIQTDTYTRTEINTKLTDGSVTKVSTTAGTFDDNGLTIEKTDAKTKGNFNEKGITVMDATSSSAEELLFAGYDEELSETIVRTKNINVEKYLTKCNIAREEAYTNLTLGGKGIGVFIL